MTGANLTHYTQSGLVFLLVSSELFQHSFVTTRGGYLPQVGGNEGGCKDPHAMFPVRIKEKMYNYSRCYFFFQAMKEMHVMRGRRRGDKIRGVSVEIWPFHFSSLPWDLAVR